MLIGKLAEITGLSKDGIRHYEQLGLIASSPRQAGSRCCRDYDESMAETIENVRLAQQLGFSLREIVPLLKAYRETPPTRAEAVAFLSERLTVVREKLASLRGVEAIILDKLRHYEVHACRPPTAGKAASRGGKGFADGRRRRKARPA
jgi:DNA-binding transcriptional MerR regulator